MVSGGLRRHIRDIGRIATIELDKFSIQIRGLLAKLLRFLEKSLRCHCKKLSAVGRSVLLQNRPPETLPCPFETLMMLTNNGGPRLDGGCRQRRRDAICHAVLLVQPMGEFVKDNVMAIMNIGHRIR